MPAERLINAAFVRTMAAYNAEMNRRLTRPHERGASWGSIHKTLTHLLWADRIWMSRFDGWPPPATAGKGGTDLVADFADLRSQREEDDAKIIAWANRSTTLGSTKINPGSAAPPNAN